MIRTLFLVLIGAVVLAVVGLVVGGRGHGPDYAGGSFPIWLKRAGPEARVDEAVSMEGAAALPDLTALVDWQPSTTERVSRKIYEALPESWQSPFRLLNVSDPDLVRRQALQALGGLGSEAAPALATVLPWAGTADETGQAALTAALQISPMAPAVTSQVLTLLLDSDPARKEMAARAMVAADVPVEGGLPALLESVGASQPPSVAVVLALGLYGSEAGRAVPRLAPWLRDPNLKQPILLTFRRLGSSAGLALTEIRPELSAQSPVVVEALDVASGLGPAATPLLPQIVPLEANPAAMIRLMAALARGKVGQDLPGAVKALAREVQFQIPDYSLPYFPDHPGLRSIRFTPAQTAAWQLGELGRRAEAATPELGAALRSEDPRLVVLAAWALWRINQDAELVVPALRRSLRYTLDPVTQLIALEAVAELGPIANLFEEELMGVQRLSLPLRQAAQRTRDRLEGRLPELELK